MVKGNKWYSLQTLGKNRYLVYVICCHKKKSEKGLGLIRVYPGVSGNCTKNSLITKDLLCLFCEEMRQIVEFLCKYTQPV